MKERGRRGGGKKTRRKEKKKNFSDCVRGIQRNVCIDTSGKVGARINCGKIATSATKGGGSGVEGGKGGVHEEREREERGCPCVFDRVNGFGTRRVHAWNATCSHRARATHIYSPE